MLSEFLHIKRFLSFAQPAMGNGISGIIQRIVLAMCDLEVRRSWRPQNLCVNGYSAWLVQRQLVSRTRMGFMTFTSESLIQLCLLQMC